MLAVVGDRYVIEVAVEPTDAGFENALPTTWRELLDDGLTTDHETATTDLPRYASDELEGPFSERSKTRCR